MDLNYILLTLKCLDFNFNWNIKIICYFLSIKTLISMNMIIKCF